MPLLRTQNPERAASPAGLRRLLRAFLFMAAIGAGLTPSASAQYPGHIDTTKKPAQTLRAIAVIEWTGKAGAPSASRIIPLSVFDGEQYQPGGLYLAQPEPLAVESGTEYILENAGVPQGLFDVKGAQDVQGYWFGYGAWKPLETLEKHAKRPQGKLRPHVVTEQDNRPHFSNRSSSGSNSGSSTSQGTPAPDSGGPVLQRRTGSDSTTSSNQSGSAGSSQGNTPQTTSQSPSATQSGSGTSQESSDADPDRPVLYRRQGSESTSSTDQSGTAGSSQGSNQGSTPQTTSQSPSATQSGSGTSQESSDTDPDRPVLYRRQGSESTSSTNQSVTAGSGSSQGDTSQTTASSGSQGTPAPDPDRPTLRRRQDSASASSNHSSSALEPETPIGGVDPDRPHLTRGKQNPTDKDFEPANLVGDPSDLEQMIAVSDASDREPHSFAYQWASPDDAAKMQAQLATLAAQAIAATEPAHPQAKPPAGRTRAKSRTAAAAPEAALPVLTDESLHAYELTYSGGATLVFSAESTDQAGKSKYVTLIAQPDFYGAPVVIFKSVTDDNQLDQSPRMRLVGAVDARADDRGDLVFELRSKNERQFVIYQVAGGRADQIFTTGALPA